MTGSLLITGPPASGKSRAAIERFLAIPESTFVVPSATMAEHVRHEFARSGAAVRPHRIATLAHFVDARSAQGAASPALVNLLIREAIARLDLPRFRSVAGYPGFHAAIAGLLEEAPASAVPADLARIFGQVEKGLAQRGLALRRDRLKAAAENREPVPAHVVFDGFFSFSPAELSLIEELAKRAAITVTLPLWSGGEGSRRRLIAARFAEQILAQQQRPPAAELFAAATLERETEEIARRILAEASQGRPLREIGIVLRVRDPYGPALETAFARFGIPARFYFLNPLGSHPAIDYLKRLVQAYLAGWDYEILLSAIRMPVSGTGATAAGDAFDFAWREKLPGSGLPLRGLEGVPAALASLEKLSWTARADPQTWAARLKALRDSIPRAAIEDGLDRDELDRLRSTSAALDAFGSALDETAAMLAAGEITLAEFWTNVQPGLELKTLRVADRRRNVVHVMDVFEARQWELPVMFVCGMAERHFPQYHREDPLLNDAARRRAGLKTSGDLQREEGFLFEIAASRATEKTIFSYARFNEKGDGSLRSFFLDRTEIEPGDSCSRIRPRPVRAAASVASASIRNDALIAQLGQLHRKLSPTSIENFLQCPFQFFAGKTLRLRPRPAEPRNRLDVLLQGSILHRALAGLARAPLLGRDVFDQAFEEECRRANVPQTYRTEAVRLELLRNFEAFAAESGVSLGWTTRVEEKFSFALNPLVSISGRIDRLDIGRLDIGQRDQALVIDYKYSRGGKIRDLVAATEDGDRVQGGLYLAAAQRVFGFEPAGMLYCGLRREVAWDGWHVPIPALEKIGESRTRQALQDLIDEAVATASKAYEAIASGEIAPQPADPDKCVWCDFRDVCRVESAARVTAAGGL